VREDVTRKKNTRSRNNEKKDKHTSKQLLEPIPRIRMRIRK
jgi:hypothetical protein